VRVTYFGQACVRVEAAGQTILIDPWLSEGAYFGTWFHTHLLADAGVTPENVAKGVDYLFLSHEHPDHFDPTTLRYFSKDTPVLICRFTTPKFRLILERLGFRNVHEMPPGEELKINDGLKVTVFGSAEYTNDSAILIESEGCTLFNETDCKLNFADLQRIGDRGIDIGFYMFSGANWYPISYDFPARVMEEQVRRRRQSLLRSFVQRVKVTRPRFAVPSSGPCMMLDPDLLPLNFEQRGIFIDPVEAVATLKASNLPVEGLYMKTTDVWDSTAGFEAKAPIIFNVPRRDYVLEASERMAPRIRAQRLAEPRAGNDLGYLLVNHFSSLVAEQTPAIRRRIDASLVLEVTGPQGGKWTVDFTATGREFVSEGMSPDWTYRIKVEDKLLYPFLTGEAPFFEELLLSLRARLTRRRPEDYNEPLYHFLYEPDPEKLHNWYAVR
jgi:UDP-MurNAc hydroxylase